MMELYAGLDISDKQTHICLVDVDGTPVWRGRCATDPDVIAKVLVKRVAALSASLKSGDPCHGLQLIEAEKN